MWGTFRFGLLGAMAVLSACAQNVYAPQAEVDAARYVSNEAPYVSLMTMVDNEDGKGAHSAILVNGSQVALYDPAGTFKHPTLPERNDVFYGITPTMKTVYELYHARDSHHVIEQKLPVSRAFANQVIARMEAQGPSPKLFCAINVSDILRDFEIWKDVPSTYYPGEIMAAFGEVPGVTVRKVEENDTGQNVRMVLVNR
jgi:hypothetical protein